MDWDLQGQAVRSSHHESLHHKSLHHRLLKLGFYCQPVQVSEIRHWKTEMLGFKSYLSLRKYIGELRCQGSISYLRLRKYIGELRCQGSTSYLSRNYIGELICQGSTSYLRLRKYLGDLRCQGSTSHFSLRNYDLKDLDGLSWLIINSLIKKFSFDNFAWAVDFLKEILYLIYGFYVKEKW